MAGLDLIVLTPDLDYQKGLAAILARPEALGVRRLEYHILRNAMHDAFVARYAPEILRPYLHEAAYAIVLLDFEGSGQEAMGAGALPPTFPRSCPRRDGQAEARCSCWNRRWSGGSGATRAGSFRRSDGRRSTGMFSSGWGKKRRRA